MERVNNEKLMTDHDCSTMDTDKMCVSIVPIFNHLEPGQMDEVMQTVQSTSYKKGELIFHEGDPSDTLYIVNTGKVKIYRLSEAGKEHLVSLMNPGDFTGEYALFNESTHTSYAEAMVDTKICKINREDLHAFLSKYPTISLKMLTEFSQRLDRSEKQTTHFATEKVETRIALFLAELANNEPDSETLELPMTRADLASYLGTTPETISRRLSVLEDQGFIQQITNKKIKIVDLDGLLLI
ncbi:Crp/Fnr family transcriptional regulator [Salicibibacter halophilus]|uniref:Crp/Fnr family transcriptional regulator n=1 Tax=Salicibibacter halophilus TaxID=2502791 RepID=A0A514LLL3_9BACI|nr:Crp/Fnr family transcriptional regulator [Salicibibacter halophilus]QDI92151.1 Crp/Fnr family transcriptional regulator [Salicibibacter halophilus]